MYMYLCRRCLWIATYVICIAHWDGGEAIRRADAGLAAFDLKFKS